MKVRPFQLAACIAWAAVAVASAAPANALAVTKQEGDFATCNGDFSNHSTTACDITTSYLQNIRFLSTACNAGGICNDAFSAVYLTQILSTGRKTASYSDSCGLLNVYYMGTCGC